MISRAEFLRDCIEVGDVRAAIEHILDRAMLAADIPDRKLDLDSSQRLRDCLDRMIDEFKAARRDV